MLHHRQQGYGFEKDRQREGMEVEMHPY